MRSLLSCPGQLFERFVISALNLLRQILQCEDYTPPQNIRLSEGTTAIARLSQSHSQTPILFDTLSHFFYDSRDSTSLPFPSLPSPPFPSQ